MIDNFELIKKLLKFDSEDDFYFCQVFRRKKDNPEMKGGRNNSDRSIKNFYITSVEKLELYKEEMIALATITNSRVGIDLNRKSFEKVALQSLKITTDYLINKDYKSVKKSYSSACGTTMNEPNKKWIIDIDDKDFNSSILDEFLYLVEPVGNKVIAQIPTKNGYHLIVKPFNINALKYSKYNSLDIHKINPTVLYIP